MSIGMKMNIRWQIVPNTTGFVWHTFQHAIAEACEKKYTSERADIGQFETRTWVVCVLCAIGGPLTAWNTRTPPKAESTENSPTCGECGKVTFYGDCECDLIGDPPVKPTDGAPDTVWITDGQYPYFKDGWTGGDWSCDDGQCGEPYTRADLHQADLVERDARIAELEVG